MNHLVHVSRAQEGPGSHFLLGSAHWDSKRSCHRRLPLGKGICYTSCWGLYAGPPKGPAMDVSLWERAFVKMENGGWYVSLGMFIMIEKETGGERRWWVFVVKTDDCKKASVLRI